MVLWAVVLVMPENRPLNDQHQRNHLLPVQLDGCSNMFQHVPTNSWDPAGTRPAGSPSRDRDPGPSLLKVGSHCYYRFDGVGTLKPIGHRTQATIARLLVDSHVGVAKRVHRETVLPRPRDLATSARERAVSGRGSPRGRSLRGKR